MGYFGALIAGIVLGSTYSLIAMPVTLMARTTGVLSFAHAGFAMMAAYIYAALSGVRVSDKLVGQGSTPPWQAAIIALAATVVLGLLVERLAIRRVSRASGTMRLIATLALLLIATSAALIIWGFYPLGAPGLFSLHSVHLGIVGVTYQEMVIVAIAAASALGLGFFLRTTRFGLAVQAVAQNREAAELMGVSTAAIARFNWGLGALLAGIAGVLTAGLAPVTVAAYPLVLMVALTASLFGALVSLPMTLLGGILVGIVQSETTMFTTMPGASQLAVLGLLVLLLVFRRNWPVEMESAQQAGVFHHFGNIRALAVGQKILAPRVEKARPWVVGAAAAAVLFMVIRSVSTSDYWAFVGTVSIFYMIEALSLSLLVGWTGQISLMHGAFVGIGAFVTAYLVKHGVPLEVTIPTAGVAGMVLGALVGIPALRLSSLQFAIASLAFSAVCTEWFFYLSPFPRYLPRGTFFGFDLMSDKGFFLFAAIVAGVLYLIAWNVRRSSHWPVCIAARDMGQDLGHFAHRPTRVRVSVFLLASFMAAVGGSLYGLLLGSFAPQDFSVIFSITLLLYAVVGGLDSLAGPVIAALAFGFLPQILQREAGAEANAWPNLISGLVVIGLVLLRPSGLASFVSHRRTALRRREARSPFEVRYGRFDAVLAMHEARAAMQPISGSDGGQATRGDVAAALARHRRG